MSNEIKKFELSPNISKPLFEIDHKTGILTVLKSCKASINGNTITLAENETLKLDEIVNNAYRSEHKPGHKDGAT